MKTFVVLYWMLVCSLAHAQPLPDPPSFLLQHGPSGSWKECSATHDCQTSPGVRGVWFELGVAQRLVVDQRAALELQGALAKTETKVSLTGERLRICEIREYTVIAELHDTKAMLGTTRALAYAQEQRAQRAERSLKAWYNRKGLWFGLGVGVAAALAWGAVALAH